MDGEWTANEWSVRVHTAAEEQLKPSHKHDKVSNLPPPPDVKPKMYPGLDKTNTKFSLFLPNHHLPPLCVYLLSVQRREDPGGHVFIFCISNTSITEKCPATGCESGPCHQTQTEACTHRKREKQIKFASLLSINLHFEGIPARHSE